MSTLFSTREASPGRNPTCVVFHWIGQSMRHCDWCGRPVTEHLYWPPFGGEKPIFRVKQKGHEDVWLWQEVGSFVEVPR